jgi:hypothetical protein
MRSPRLGSSQFCCHNQTDPEVIRAPTCERWRPDWQKLNKTHGQE